MTALLPELSMEAADEAETAESEAVSPPAETSGETVIVIESSSTILVDESVLPPTVSNEEESSSIDDSALTDTLLEDLLRDAVRSENPTSEAVTEPPTEPEAPAEDSAPKALLALPPPEATTEPAREAAAAELFSDLAEQTVHGDDVRDGETELPRETEEQKAADVVVPVVAEPARPSSKDPSSVSLLPLVAPDDDPGDLFDVTPPVPSNAASMPEPMVAPPERTLEPAQAIRTPLAASIPSDAKAPAPPSPPLQQSRVAAAPAQPQPVPRPATNDPLGPVRALSEEETIALFS